MTATFLIVFAFLATVTGTCWNSSNKGKFVIVGIATLSCVGAVYQSFEANKESEFRKRILENIIRATEPPEIFIKALRDGVREYAKRNKLWMHQQEKTKKEIAIFFLAPIGSNPGESDVILLLREPTIEHVFLSYVSGTPIADAIELSLINQWGKKNLEKNWNDFVGTLTDIVTLTATYSKAWRNTKFKVNSEYNREKNLVRVVVYDESLDKSATVEFDKNKINEILQEKTILRDKSVFNYTTQQLLNIKKGI